MKRKQLSLRKWQANLTLEEITLLTDVQKRAMFAFDRAQYERDRKYESHCVGFGVPQSIGVDQVTDFMLVHKYNLQPLECQLVKLLMDGEGLTRISRELRLSYWEARVLLDQVRDKVGEVVGIGQGGRGNATNGGREDDGSDEDDGEIIEKRGRQPLRRPKTKRKAKASHA